MKALIIGAGGFVGHYLLKELLKTKGIDIFATKMENEDIDFPSEVTTINLDITDVSKTLDVIDNINPDFIYHLAAQSSVALSWKIPQKTFHINVIGTLNILQALKQINFKGRMMFIGSGEEYGRFSPERLPIDENCPLCPQNIYAETKAEGERLCLLYNQVFLLDIVCVRSFNHIGPMQRENFVASDFAKQIAEIEKGIKEPKIFVGNLSAIRDFTDVRDVVKAYILLMEKGYSGDVYNVGGGSVCSIERLLENLINLSNKKPEVVIDKSKFRPVDIPKIYANISKIKIDTGFEFEYTLEQTLKDVLDYWRKKVE